jgi:hypothetical protein
MTTKTQLQKILEGILHTEDESKTTTTTTTTTTTNHERMGSIKPQEKKRQLFRVALIQLHTIKP